MAAAGLLGLAGPGLAAQAGRARMTALINASVVDVEQGRILPGQTILTDGDHIVSVTPSARTRLPTGTVTVNLAGRFVIPGLWDMHVHQQEGAWFDSLRARPDARADATTYFRGLFLAAGVTGIRDMAGDLEGLRAAELAAQQTGALSPRALVTGEKLGQRPVVPGAPFPVATPEDVAASARLVLRGGAAHLKLAPPLDPELVRAALSACRTERIWCVGHAPERMTIGEASELGLRSIEHLFGFSEETSSLGRDRITAWRAQLEKPTLLQRVGYKLRLLHRPPQALDDTVLATHDSARAAQLFRRLAASGTWVTPTLTLSELLWQASPRDSLARNPALLVEPPDSPEVDRRSPETRARAARVRALNHRLIRGMRAAGVGLLAGTDAPLYAVPGASLHGELLLLQEAGLTPLEALRTATLEPARYVHGSDSLGSVAAGRVADLVVLRANPLLDVRATREIEMVMTRGRLLRRAQLDSLVATGVAALARVRAAVASTKRAVPR